METPIEQFCDDLLLERIDNNENKSGNNTNIGNIGNNSNNNRDTDGNINDRNNDSDDDNDEKTDDTKQNNHGNSNNNINNNNKNNSIQNNNDQKKSPPPSWIRSVYLTALNYGQYAALLLIVIYIIFAIIRLSLLPSSRVLWIQVVLEPIVSILLCMFPLSFSLPLGLLFVEATTTAGFLATSEVILRGDSNVNEKNEKNDRIDRRDRKDGDRRDTITTREKSEKSEKSERIDRIEKGDKNAAESLEFESPGSVSGVKQSVKNPMNEGEAKGHGRGEGEEKDKDRSKDDEGERGARSDWSEKNGKDDDDEKRKEWEEKDDTDKKSVNSLGMHSPNSLSLSDSVSFCPSEEARGGKFTDRKKKSLMGDKGE